MSILAKREAELNKLRSALEQIEKVCRDNSKSPYPEMVLKFVIEVCPVIFSPRLG